VVAVGKLACIVAFFNMFSYRHFNCQAELKQNLGSKTIKNFDENFFEKTDLLVISGATAVTTAFFSPLTSCVVYFAVIEP